MYPSSDVGSPILSTSLNYLFGYLWLSLLFGISLCWFDYRKEYFLQNRRKLVKNCDSTATANT